MSNYSLVFDSEEKLHDVLAALTAYGRKETSAGEAADAMGLESYSGNARKTVKEVVLAFADLAGLNDPFVQQEEPADESSDPEESEESEDQTFYL